MNTKELEVFTVKAMVHSNHLQLLSPSGATIQQISWEISTEMGFLIVNNFWRRTARQGGRDVYVKGEFRNKLGLGYAAIGDFNGDGIADLAAGDSGKNASGLEYGWAVVQLGNGDGTFSPPLSGRR